MPGLLMVKAGTLVSGAVGGSLQSLRDCVGEHCRVAGAAHRHFSKDVIDQMCPRLDHPPCTTRGAEAPAFAGELHKVFETAAVALPDASARALVGDDAADWRHNDYANPARFKGSFHTPM